MQIVAANMARTKPKNSSKNKSDTTAELDFAQLFQEYYPRIYNYLRYRVNSVDDAEDLISKIFEQAYTCRQQFDPAKGAFSAWLFGIARNELVSHYRIRERHSAWETEDEFPADLVIPEPSLEAQVIHKESIVQLLQGIERLNDRDQEIITLKFAGKLKNTEIGEILDMKEKTVSVVLLRAVRRLRQEIEKEAAK